ncbi:MAG: T9SS type A sorting domain-containing protein [Bacteroidia bacterium]|nr:T9SS type A sorting domain-containing protein [Bacteroidia bacterium]
MECLKPVVAQTPPGSGQHLAELVINNANITPISGSPDHIFEWNIVNPNPGQNFVFSLDMTIDCNALSVLDGNATFDVVQKWYIDNSGSYVPLIINGNSQELVTNVDYPLFEDVRLISSPNGNIYSANYLGINATNNYKYLYFEYANAGSSTANVFVNFEDLQNDLQICLNSYSFIDYSYTIIPENTIVDDISALTFPWTSYAGGTNLPVIILNSEKIVFREKVNVNGCECFGGKVKFSWKCNMGSIFQNPAECQECQKDYVSSFAIQRTGTYDVSYSIPTPTLIQRQYDHTCSNANTGWDIILENTGQNAVADVIFSMGYNGNIDQTTLELIDRSSFTYTFSSPSTGSFATPIDLSNPVPMPINGTPTNGNCGNCITYSSTTQLCSSVIQNPINSLAFIIKELLVGQRCTIHFEMFRCIEEADNILLNEEKRFNLWSTKVNGRDECQNGFSIPGAGWLGFDAIKTPEMDLELFMFPAVYNLTAWPPIDPGNPNCPQNPPYSSNLQVSNNVIYMNGMFVAGDHYSYGVLGATNNASNPLSGILRVKVKTQQGLLVDESNSPSALISGGETWLPINTSPINTESGCSDTEYFYYYDLANPPAGTTAKELLDAGQFNWRMIPCCTADPTSTYEVLFHLLIDPMSTGCQSAIGIPGSYNITPQNYTNINFNYKWLPLSNVEELINVQCPGCRAPGVIVDNYQMIRSDNSFGLPDELNDRLADTQTAIDISTYAQASQLNRRASMHGDFIEDRLEAHFQDGSIDGPLNSSGLPCDNSIIGYEYFQMAPHSLDKLELRRTFSQNALVQMGLEVQSVTVYIDKPCATCLPTECLDCNLFDSNPINFHTQVQYDYVNGAGVNPYNINSNTMILTFDAADFITASNGAVLNTTTNALYDFQIKKFEPDQRYRIIVRYAVCGNFMSVNDPDNGVLQTTIDNMLYLTGDPWLTQPTPMPNNESALNSVGWTSDPSNTLYTHISDPTFTNSFGFYCETSSGGHSFISNEYFSTLSLTSPVVFTENGCDRYISFWSSSTIGGGSTYDFFPYEIRRPRLVPDQWSFDASNLNITSIESTSSNFYGNQASSLIKVDATVISPYSCPLSPTCNVNISDISSSSPAINCFMNSTQSDLAIGDQKFILSHKINLDVGGSNNCDLSGNLVVSGFFASNTTDYCSSGGISVPTCSSSLNLQPITKTQILTEDMNPNLNLAITVPQITAISNTICWGFKLKNVDDFTGAITPAFNIFLDLSSYTSFLTNVVVTINGTQINFNSNNQGIIYASLGVGDEISGTICAQYSSCTDHDPILGFIPIELNWGWDCDGLPAPTNPLNSIICQNEIADLALVNSTTSFLLDPGPTTPFILCQPFTLKPSLESNGRGELQAIDFSLLNMPIGLTVVGTPICTIDVNGTINSIPLTSIGFNQWAFPTGTELEYGNILNLEITFLPICEYKGFLPQIDFNVVNYCGNSLDISANYPGLLQMTGNDCTNCFTITKTPSTYNIPLNTTIDFYIEICNLSPSLTPVPSFQILDNLPPNFVVTSPLPTGFIAWPAVQCTTLILTGYFTQIPPGGIAINKAELLLDPFVSGGPFTAQCTLQVASDCASFADQVTLQGHNESTSYTFYPNETIYIIEDFFIKHNVSYSNNTFYVNPGVEIVVEAGKTLVLENSRIYSCTDMWKGMRVEDGGTLVGGTLIAADSEICDAEYAVFQENNSTVFLENSKLYRNYVGLFIPQALTGLNSVSTDVRNCQFATFGTIRPNYAGQLTLPGVKSLSGVLSHDAILNLGSQYQPNRFYDMSNGVISRNTSISITNCIFEDIVPDPVYQNLTQSMVSNTSYNGSAIYAIGRFGGLLKQRGFGKNGQTAFDNCKYGIFTDRMNVDSRDNNMTNMLTGYRTNFGSNLTMDITGNHIESRSTAIDLRFNDNADHLWVSDNEIYFGEFVSGAFRGVSAIQSLERQGSNRDSRIHNNNIFYNSGANNAANGISMTSTSDYFVTENDLFMTDNLVNINGIIVSGSNKTEISCNVVDGSNNLNASVHQSAITNVLGSDPIISCNVVDKTMNGIRMVGDAGLNVVLQGNEFNNHNKGLFYNQGITNSQDWKGNLWPVTPVNLNWGAFSDNPIIASFSPYSYDNSNPPSGLSFEPTTSSLNPVGFEPPNWFQPGIDYTNETFYCLVNNHHYCDQFPPCPDCPIDIVIHERIARDSIENTPYTAETLWRLKRELYRNLLSDSTLLANSLFENFYNEMEVSVAAQLEQLTGEQYEMMQLDQSVINNLNQNRNALDVQMALLAEQMELYRHALESAEDPSVYLLTIQGIRQNMESILNYNRNVFSIADSSLVLTTDNIRFVNESIYSSETIEVNEQVVNEIFLSVIGQEQFQLGDDAINQLEVIADQCPLAGGNAVFKARAILSLLNDELVYDDINICLQAGIILRQIPKKPTARLYPNPANNSVTLVYELPEVSTAEFLLFNSVGMLQLKQQMKIDITQMSFSTEQLAPGVYHYQVNTSSDFQLNGKLVIIH